MRYLSQGTQPFPRRYGVPNPRVARLADVKLGIFISWRLEMDGYTVLAINIVAVLVLTVVVMAGWFGSDR